MTPSNFERNNQHARRELIYGHLLIKTALEKFIKKLELDGSNGHFQNNCCVNAQHFWVRAQCQTERVAQTSKRVVPLLITLGFQAKHIVQVGEPATLG